MAASSLSASKSATRAWEACVSVASGLSSSKDVRSTVGGAVTVSSQGGMSIRAIKSFIEGTADVAQAKRLESLGHMARADGVKPTQAFE